MKLKTQKLVHDWKKVKNGHYKCVDCQGEVLVDIQPPDDYVIPNIDSSVCLKDIWTDFGPGAGEWPEYAPPPDKDERLYVGELVVKLMTKNPELNTEWIGKAYKKDPKWLMDCVGIHYKLCNEAKGMLKDLQPDMVKSLISMLPDKQKDHLSQSGLLIKGICSQCKKPTGNPEKYLCQEHEESALIYDTIIKTLNMKISAGVDPREILVAITRCGVTQ